MSTARLPPFMRDGYEVAEWKHATAILTQDFPGEWSDIVAVLSSFQLREEDVAAGGGQKSKIAGALDAAFYARGWREKKFDTKVEVDGNAYASPTHKVDCFKNGIGLEIEWNNKDPFFDRDLNNFRLLFDLRAVHVGVIVTRSDELKYVFAALDKARGMDRKLADWRLRCEEWKKNGQQGRKPPRPASISAKYGESTTHMGKLLPRIEGGGGGGCPLLVFAIKRALYVGQPLVEVTEADLPPTEDDDEAEPGDV